MAEPDCPELLFFDTFSHDINEDLNLDLVQFPKPVYITEVRIIPLGARVEADFPGGVRLGATNPSQFRIEFFVNDLGKPGASTFEIFGSFDYNQNDSINLESAVDPTCRQIPTDGLVLRGVYTTITLAVYGTLTKNLTEPIVSPPAVSVPPPTTPAAVPAAEKASSFDDVDDWTSDGGGATNSAPPMKPFAGTSSQAEVFSGESYEDREFQDVKEPRYGQDDWNHSATECEEERDSNWSEQRRSLRSKDYSRSSRSPEFRKRPRTPPPVDSPPRNKMPRSPDVKPDDDDTIKSDGDDGMDTGDASLSETPDDNTLLVLNESQDDLDQLSQNGEPFEPILSDEELPPHEPETPPPSVAQPFDNIDYDVSELDGLIKKFDFDPIINALQRYIKPEEVFKEVEGVSKILQRIKAKDPYSSTGFTNLSRETKESWVHLSEQLNQIASHFHNSPFLKRTKVLCAFFRERDNALLITQWIRIGLDFEAANAQPQPAYKIRHIKAGARLVENFCCSEEFSSHLLEKEGVDLFSMLFNLYNQPYMALSIKLMIIKAMHSCLDSKIACQHFLKSNGYQKLLNAVNVNPLTRVKFALKSLLKKINLYESFVTMNEFIVKHFMPGPGDNFDEDMMLFECILKDALKSFSWDILSNLQPKRFLPLTSKFEFGKDVASIRSTSAGFHSFFTIFGFLETILLIVSSPHSIQATLFDCCLDVLAALSRDTNGMDYLIDHLETTQHIVRSLLNLPAEQDIENILIPSLDIKILNTNDDLIAPQEKQSNDRIRTISSSGYTTEIFKPIVEDGKPTEVAYELAYKVQARYHLDILADNNYRDVATLYDDQNKISDALQSLQTMSVDWLARPHCISILAMDNNLVPLLNLIERERKLGAKIKSPILSYSIDLIDAVVRHSSDLNYLEEFGQTLLDLAKSHDGFESQVAAMLQELTVYLKPLEVPNVFQYDDIQPLCEVIKRSVEYLTTFPGDLITGLRILKHLGIPAHAESTHIELKCKFVILQLYSHDGILMIVSILDKLAEFFEQPSLHITTLSTSMQGLPLMEILLPAVMVLRQMLTHVIKCRNAHYKDVTAVEALLKIYTLMHFCPRSAGTSQYAQQVQLEIIKTLLAYTQPTPLDDDVDTTDTAVHKSLWTQMIGEILKYILHGPCTFTPGLLAFSELLPLPLPLPTNKSLTDTEVQRLVTERQLWSAHLHPQSPVLTEMIQSICLSTCSQLTTVLGRVCLQLADLAPNMTLVVVKAIVDLILTNDSSANLARLLSFIATLSCYPSVKVSILSVLSGKLMDTFMQLLQTGGLNSNHLRSQQLCHKILQNLLDSGNSLLPDAALESSIPSKEIIYQIATATVDCLTLAETSMEVRLAAMKTALALTEHDILIYHLRAVFYKKREDTEVTLRKLVDSYVANGQCVEFFEMFLKFITAITTIRGNQVNRTISLTASELALVLKWHDLEDKIIKMEEETIEEIDADDSNEKKAHPLRLFSIILAAEEKHVALCECLTTLITCLEHSSKIANLQDLSEPTMQQAEGIVTQFGSRAMFTLQSNAHDGKLLEESYWLSPPSPTLRDDTAEQIQCDLIEMILTCLPIDTNLTSDCKRLLHLSASPQSARERTTTAPCFRTRRVEVEPTTGRPEKKLFVTRGRGFARTPPSRGDLFRSRPPNTSRPPSLHVDDFLALETCGAQPTGPTGYNKLSRDMIRGGRGRGRGRGISSSSGVYRQPRTNSPSTWSSGGDSGAGNQPPPPQHFRTATSEPVVVQQHFQSEYSPASHFSGRGRGRGLRTPRNFNR